MWCAFFFTYTYAEMPEWSKGVDSRPTTSLRAGSNPALGKRVSGWMPEWSKGMDLRPIAGMRAGSNPAPDNISFYDFDVQIKTK